MPVLAWHGMVVCGVWHACMVWCVLHASQGLSGRLEQLYLASPGRLVCLLLSPSLSPSSSSSCGSQLLPAEVTRAALERLISQEKESEEEEKREEQEDGDQAQKKKKEKEKAEQEERVSD